MAHAGSQGKTLLSDPAPTPPEATVWVLPVSHLDTQWGWTIRDTIRRFLPRTIRDNLDRLRRFPSYRVNFDGAFRYALMQEYEPEGFAAVCRAVAEGRWQVSGATWEACDVNLPSPESLVRQVLYGNRFFQRELGVEACDFFLPDCFGFGWALPSIAAHCGLLGFVTQKLRRDDWMRSSVGVPFHLGVWEGPDGATVLAALDPGGYGDPLRRSPAVEPEVQAALQSSAEPTAVRFFGVGDKGGAPDDQSLAMLESAVAAPGGPRVRCAGSGELFRDLERRGAANRLPRYSGELLLTEHAAGAYTSQGAMKRWNRRNEGLAAAAEAAAVVASWLGGLEYPAGGFRDAWRRFLAHQFHDDLTGTSIPAAYRFSWNDELIAATQLRQLLERSLAGVAAALDTRCEGQPLLLFNPLGVPRTDVVSVRLEGSLAAGIEVRNERGEPVPAQLGERFAHHTEVLFLAALPAVGFAVYEIHRTPLGTARDSSPRIDLDGIENERYRVRLSDDGDLASIFDKALDRELLRESTALELLPDTSRRFPAWEIRYADVSAAPRARVAGPARVSIAESGPARVALRVERQALGSSFVQWVRLAAGAAGDRLEVETEVDWRTRGALLKASFPLAAEAESATYDLGWGVVERGVNRPELYEVPAQQWADQSDEQGDFGVAILSDHKAGWDRPERHRLRLSLLHTPATGRRFRHQSFQDLGRHRISWALCGHSGDWRGGVAAQAARFASPIIAARVPPHTGSRRSLSFLELSPGIALRALKGEEEGDGTIVRLQEELGEAGEAVLRVGDGIAAACQIDGQERPLAPLVPRQGELRVPLKPFQPMAFRLEPVGGGIVTSPRCLPLSLGFDLATASYQGEWSAGFDGRGRSLPAELLPSGLDWSGVRLELGRGGATRPNALSCRGQQLTIPEGEWRSLVLLVAATHDLGVAFRMASSEITRDVPSWRGWHGQWQWRGRFGVSAPAFWRQGPLAWVSNHLHDARGRNRVHEFAYLFAVRVPVEPADRYCRVPEEPSLRLFAATVVADDLPVVELVSPVFDRSLEWD